MDEPSKPAQQSEQDAGSKSGGVKDTIESILVAFILAFIFRAFIVEAFVIPTGSMAPTLLGAHMRFRCADCGYEFTVNYNAIHGDPEDVNIPRYAETLDMHTDASGHRTYALKPKIVSAYCPNCGFKIGDEELSDPTHELGPAKVVTAPPVHFGDRILVLKYQYIFQPPKRWDVVVFKSPPEPEVYHYTQNYIKRLVGRPGETLLILDGDVYVSNGSSDIDAFKICAKPRDVQDALWRIVYDNDYLPQGLERPETVGTQAHKWVQPWHPSGDGQGWDLTSGPAKGRAFHFNNATGNGTIAFDPTVNPEKHALTDWLAYDVTGDQEREMSKLDYTSHGGGENNVSDLKLELFYRRTSGDGPLRMSMSKQDHTFVAEVAGDKVRLLDRLGNSAEHQIGQTVSLAPTTGPRHVELINVDYRVSVRVDDADVVVTSPQDYHPDTRKLLDSYQNGQAMPPATVQITAEKQECELSHLKLWRDVYYINRGNSLKWGVPENFPDKLVHLGNEKGKEEYFVLGDNSIISGDARYWHEPVNLPNEDLIVDSGRVPARFMLGKAFFVYWPAGYRPFRDAPGLVPDFGDMRFIH